LGLNDRGRQERQQRDAGAEPETHVVIGGYGRFYVFFNFLSLMMSNSFHQPSSAPPGNRNIFDQNPSARV
jgi:hypothetical protein